MEHPLWLPKGDLHDHLNNKFEYTITREYLEKDIVSYLNNLKLQQCGQTLNTLNGTNISFITAGIFRQW